MRLVGPEGEQVGIVPIGKALELAAESDLDLVEVAPMARPPVCKLMDYGKFKYESAQKAREARRNQALTVIKEMKLRPKIDSHDYETKKGHVERFLKAGRQGEGHDHVPRTRAVPARTRVPAAAAPGRGHQRARLRRVLAEAGRPQHDHGRGAAPNAPARSRPHPGRPTLGRHPSRSRPTPAASNARHAKERHMPKNKTHSGMKKRVKVTGSGKLLHRARRQAPPARAQVVAR